jgi:hypothetical protein
MNKRHRCIDGKTEDEAFCTMVPNSKGGTSLYIPGDLKYDLQVGFLVEVGEGEEEDEEDEDEEDEDEEDEDSVASRRGVTKSGRAESWTARISHEGKRFWIGTYNTEKEAALAYDKKARQLKGGDAVCNFDESMSSTMKTAGSSGASEAKRPRKKANAQKQQPRQRQQQKQQRKQQRKQLPKRRGLYVRVRAFGHIGGRHLQPSAGGVSECPFLEAIHGHVRVVYALSSSLKANPPLLSLPYQGSTTDISIASATSIDDSASRALGYFVVLCDAAAREDVRLESREKRALELWEGRAREADSTDEEGGGEGSDVMDEDVGAAIKGKGKGKGNGKGKGIGSASGATVCAIVRLPQCVLEYADDEQEEEQGAEAEAPTIADRSGRTKEMQAFDRLVITFGEGQLEPSVVNAILVHVIISVTASQTHHLSCATYLCAGIYH